MLKIAGQIYPLTFCVRKIALALAVFVSAFGIVTGQSVADVSKAQLLFNTGNNMLATGDLTGAVQKFTEAISVLPSWHLPYLNRGVAHLSLMKLTEAEADADKALGLIQPGTSSGNEHSGIAYQIKGTVKQHQGHNTAALEQFSRSVELVPSNAKFHNSKGTALRLLDRKEEARTSYNKAIELEPKIALFYVNRASIHERLKDNIAALRDLDEALKLDKSFGSAYYTRANLRMRSKEYAEALLDFNEAIRLEPKKSAYFHARGLLHNSTKNFDLAIKDHTEAIAIDPRNANAFSDRAIAFGSSGNTKAAIDDLKSALILNPESAALRYNLGHFLYQGGQFTESVDSATQVISRHPNWRSPYILRSNCYVKLGLTAKAKADRAKAATLGSNGRPVNEPYVVFDLEVFVPEGSKP